MSKPYTIVDEFREKLNDLNSPLESMVDIRDANDAFEEVVLPFLEEITLLKNGIREIRKNISNLDDDTQERISNVIQKLGEDFDDL